MSSPAKSFWSETPVGAERDEQLGVNLTQKLTWNLWKGFQFAAGMSVCVLTSIGLALPGVITGHLAVSSVRKSSVIAALRLAVKISILQQQQLSINFFMMWM